MPNSRKVYIEGKEGVRVPMREIALSGGEPAVRVYDTSGPEGQDVRRGILPLREKWIRARGEYDLIALRWNVCRCGLRWSDAERTSRAPCCGSADWPRSSGSCS